MKLEDIFSAFFIALSIIFLGVQVVYGFDMKIFSFVASSLVLGVWVGLDMFKSWKYDFLNRSRGRSLLY